MSAPMSEYAAEIIEATGRYVADTAQAMADGRMPEQLGFALLAAGLLATSTDAVRVGEQARGAAKPAVRRTAVNPDDMDAASFVSAILADMDRAIASGEVEEDVILACVASDLLSESCAASHYGRRELAAFLATHAAQVANRRRVVVLAAREPVPDDLADLDYGDDTGSGSDAA